MRLCQRVPSVLEASSPETNFVHRAFRARMDRAVSATTEGPVPTRPIAPAFRARESLQRTHCTHLQEALVMLARAAGLVGLAFIFLKEHASRAPRACVQLEITGSLARRQRTNRLARGRTLLRI